MQLQASETNVRTKTSKIKQYGWIVKDEPGQVAWVQKTALRVDHSYQRPVNEQKANNIAKEWSYVACGTISVAERESDGGLYIIDGQHRVMAALKRDDIQTLPCIIFKSEGRRQEAAGFIDANTLRKMPSTLQKWNAQLMRGDANTLFINTLIEQHGRTASHTTGPNTVCCLSSLLKAAESSKEELSNIWPLLSQICLGHGMHEKVIEGLLYLEKHLPDGESITKKPWRDRVLRVGYTNLLDAANKASAYYARGGARIWANGMLEALNKSCRTHMQLKSEAML